MSNWIIRRSFKQQIIDNGNDKMKMKMKMKVNINLGQKILNNQYIVKKLVGRGTFAKVFKVISAKSTSNHCNGVFLCSFLFFLFFLKLRFK